MNWDQFKEERDIYEAIWRKIKERFSGNESKFLKGAYLVVTYGSNQMSLESNYAYSGAMRNPDFFVEDRYSIPLIKLTKEYKKIKDSDTKDKKELERKAELEDDMKKMNPADLSVVEHHIELRFSSVNIELIQKLKQSEYCDRELTGMSKASIRVVLKNHEHGLTK